MHPTRRTDHEREPLAQCTVRLLRSPGVSGFSNFEEKQHGTYVVVTLSSRTELCDDVVDVTPLSALDVVEIKIRCRHLHVAMLFLEIWTTPCITDVRSVTEIRHASIWPQDVEGHRGQQKRKH